MKHCPVSDLPITERTNWKTVHSGNHYTSHIRKIGDDILLSYYETEQDITAEYMDKSLFQTVLDESGLAGKPVYMLRDLSHVTDVSYTYKKNLTQLIYHIKPIFHAIIFFNATSEFQTIAEMFASMLPDTTRVLIVNNYEDAIHAVLALKAGERIEDEYEDEEDELFAGLKKNFLAATARIGWLNMLTQPVNLPPEDNFLFPFFKAIASLQQDLLEKEKIATRNTREKEQEFELKLSEKNILLNAQLEMNNKLKSMFDRERSMLKSRIAAHDLELTRISNAIAEKSVFLQQLQQMIGELSIAEQDKKKLLDQSEKLVTKDLTEQKLTEKLTATDSEFLTRLQQEHPVLNQRDLRICLLIKLNYDTREIARSIGISTRGLESIRYRMHKKMKLGKHQSIKNYLINFSLA
ncbi:helix-turn-helix transcriptional regulator [Prosthecochloris sp. CIB 2401]|uniref:helix-turn-helix transcriptional regulator n=1 Tax=Prosthecochloris sp. CIB 2401 TaxID=1868325 RepID=UPI00080AB562|nr:hypothetical protein [Prosthecochloris sp. CIB 2401]ANT65675.1 hypothetical protein Ptc2401_01944 [Prosthecochloris sp. CIB 2401]